MKAILWQLRLIALGFVLVLPAATNAACENYASHINWVSTFRTEDCYRFSDFTIDGTTEWAIGADGDLYVVDVANPAQPALRTIHDLQGEGSRIVSTRGIGLLSLKDGQILVLDLNNPFQLTVRDTLDIGGGIWDADFRHQLAYVVILGGGVRILDLSDPNDVVLVGAMREGGTSGGEIELFGDHAFLIGDGQLFTYDLADPYHPVATDSLAVEGYLMKVVGSTLVVPKSYGISLFDIAPGQPPVFRADLPSLDSARRMEVANGLLAVSFMYEMNLYSLTDADTLIERAKYYYEAGSTSGRMKYSDGVLFHSGDLGISALDLGDGSPVELGEVMLFPGGSPRTPKARGNYVFVAGGGMGLIVYDCSSPLSPEIVGSAYVAGSVSAVEVVGDLAYVMGSDTFAVLDISDPTRPRSVGAISDFDGYASDLAVSGGIAWGSGSYDIYGIDVSDPTAPYLRYSLDVSNWARHVEVEGGLLHSLGEYGDYDIFSLATDPPSLLSSTNTTGYGASLAVRGDLVALGSGIGITFVDVSDPTAPQVLSNYPLASHVYHISLHGNRALVSAGGGGLITLDISNLQSPISFGTALGVYFDHALLTNGAVFTSGGATSPSGRWVETVRVIPASCELASPVLVELPDRAVQLHVYPNPFNPRTTLSFDLPAAGPCRLVVYDLQGRVVRSLCHEVRHGGPQQFVWDGRDDRGRGVASGVYMARLGHVGGTQTRKLALIR